MSRTQIVTTSLTAIIFAAIGAAAASESCTPTQLDVARPLVRSGGLVCLAVPGEDREVCAQAAELTQALFAALDERGLLVRSAAAPSADVPSPNASAPPPPAGSAASASPEPAESASP